MINRRVRNRFTDDDRLVYFEEATHTYLLTMNSVVAIKGLKGPRVR